MRPVPTCTLYAQANSDLFYRNGTIFALFFAGWGRMVEVSVVRANWTPRTVSVVPRGCARIVIQLSQLVRHDTMMLARCAHARYNCALPIVAMGVINWHRRNMERKKRRGNRYL